MHGQDKRSNLIRLSALHSRIDTLADRVARGLEHECLRETYEGRAAYLTRRIMEQSKGNDDE